MSNLDNDFLDLKQYSELMYLGYSLAVIKDRALPFLADGQKPVQRRILYAMKELGIKYDQPPKKSARVVGDVIGKYHPHGDSSVYDAMVRMSQNWNLRYPLVDGQGNFGSRDGDGAAAMRYTESRLTKFAEYILLEELKQGTTNFKNNYDNSIVEPDNMPAKLNVLLLNGAKGIAVGMACDIPSHNIRELTNATISAIDNPDITHEEIMKHLKGPDYPTGGQIVDSQEHINHVYKEGNGTIRVRAKWTLEKKAKNQWQIVINELPPGVSTADVLTEIEKITNPPIKKDKNGKPLKVSAKILQDKTFLLSVLDQAIDESDKDTPIRLVLIPKSNKVQPEEFFNSLIKMLKLEESVKFNLTMIGVDGQAENKSILHVINEWISHRFSILTKRTQFSLNKTLNRIHILEGRMLAFLNIDEVISIIKNSDEPKLDLIETFKFSDIQAEDILEIKLRQLARLEGIKIEKELEELKKESEKLESLLNSKTKMNNLMKKEIEFDTKLFEDQRRTLIKEEDKITSSDNTLLNTILDEPVTIIFTQNNWVTSRKGHNIDLSGIQLKDGDSIRFIEEGRSTENIAAFSSDGRVYNLKYSEIPNGKSGFIHIARLCDINNSNIVSLKFITGEKIFVYNSDGYGFVTNTSKLITKNKSGKSFMTLPNDNTNIEKYINYNGNKDDWFLITTTDNRILCFTVEEFLSYGELDKGKGYQLVRLMDNSKIKELKIVNPKETFIKEGRKKQNLFENKDLFLSKRALRGRKIDQNYAIIYQSPIGISDNEI